MTESLIAIIFGGQNTEYDVSCRSAMAVLGNLDRTRFQPLPIRIDSEGVWHVAKSAQVPAGVEFAQLVELTSGEVGSRADSMGRALEALGSVDAVFPVLHGILGEDGTVQGLLDLLGVPYVGNGVTAGAVGIDKVLTKAVLRANGIPVADEVVLSDPGQTLTDAERERLGLPVFVKPNTGGSSFGVSRVADWHDLDGAVALAFESGNSVLVEPAVSGREIQIAVLEHPDGRIVASPPLEIRMDSSRHAWFNSDAKYQDSTTTFAIPAPVTAETRSYLTDSAVRVFRTLRGRGLMRVDFFVDEPGRIVLNEVNTMPGLGSSSGFPAVWSSTGLSYSRMLDILLDTALARGRRVPISSAMS
jgi:D-alanine-D-alanine ligase